MSAGHSRFVTYRIAAAMALLAPVLAAATLVPPQAGAASLDDLKVNSAYGDSRGNLVVYGNGGEKIIVVGGADKAGILAEAIGRPVPVAARSAGPEIVGPPLDPHVVALIDTRSEACNAPVVLKGRSFMYGIDRNVTPALGHPGC